MEHCGQLRRVSQDHHVAPHRGRCGPCDIEPAVAALTKLAADKRKDWAVAVLNAKVAIFKMFPLPRDLIFSSMAVALDTKAKFAPKTFVKLQEQELRFSVTCDLPSLLALLPHLALCVKAEQAALLKSEKAMAALLSGEPPAKETKRGKKKGGDGGGDAGGG